MTLKYFSGTIKRLFQYIIMVPKNRLPHNKKDRKTYFIPSHTKYKVKHLIVEWTLRNLLYKKDNFKIKMYLYMLIPWIS